MARDIDFEHVCLVPISDDRKGPRPGRRRGLVSNQEWVIHFPDDRRELFVSRPWDQIRLWMARRRVWQEKPAQEGDAGESVSTYARHPLDDCTNAGGWELSIWRAEMPQRLRLGRRARADRCGSPAAGCPFYSQRSKSLSAFGT